MTLRAFFRRLLRDRLGDTSAEFPPSEGVEPFAPPLCRPYALYALTEHGTVKVCACATLQQANAARHKHAIREQMNGWKRIASDDPFGTMLYHADNDQVMSLVVIGGGG